jgi:type IX secretion system PorP/SprF family membrane protein
MKHRTLNTRLQIFLHLVLIFSAGVVMGQGISNYNLYNVNQYAINPAYTGSQNGLYTLLHFKNHFSGLSNTPRNLMFVVHSPIGNRLSLGGNITAGQAGVFKSTLANIAASYKVYLASDHRVTFGLSGGLLKQNLDMNQLGNADLTDPTLQPSYANKVYYRFGFGAVYNWDKLEVSVALPNALQQEDNLLRNYFIGYASYSLATAGEQWNIKPSILYKSLPVTKDQLDIYVQAQWKNLLWGLAGYRTNNNIILGGGLTIENMNLGYGYEVPTGTKTISRGTHEIIISFVFNKKEPAKFVKTSHEKMVPQSKMDSTYQHIKELEAEVQALKKEAGEVHQPVIVDSLRLTDNIIYSYDANEKFVKIYPGSYVVIQNCTTHEFANKLIKTYKTKGINTFKLYDQTQKVFYIVEKYFPNFDDAKYEMQKMRTKGYKNCWVLAY